MVDIENKKIPFERGYEIKEEEIADLQKRIEELIERLKQLLEKLNHEMEMANASGEEERKEYLQGQIFDLEHEIEEGEKLIMEGNWRRFDLWKKGLETKWKREDEEAGR